METIGQKSIESIEHLLGPPKTRGIDQVKGFNSEMHVFHILSSAGYDVRMELPCDYDMTVHNLDGIHRIQVKTINKKSENHSGTINLNKTSMHSKGKFVVSRYNSMAFDFLAAVDQDTWDVYLIPSFHFTGENGSMKSGLGLKQYHGYKIT